MPIELLTASDSFSTSKEATLTSPFVGFKLRLLKYGLSITDWPSQKIILLACISLKKIPSFLNTIFL